MATHAVDNDLARLRVWYALVWVVLCSGLGLCAATFLVMIKISRLLAALTVADKPAFPAGALSGWPGFNFLQDDQRVGAVAVWAGAAGELKVSDGKALVLRWIRADLLLDMLAFTPAYVIAIYP
ncbi:hypothetical protein [Streptomyces sp. NPDC127197]|uniref:hypothetical protein n=1 Tax=Streptomyces sp. NPDC127197 TaxID=3345388 RepID=UPI003639C5C2